MKKSWVFVGILGLFLTSQQAWAEIFTYQFVCIDNGHETYSGWMDERVSVRSTFEKGKSGEQFHYCENDCRWDFGWYPCSFVIPSEEGHWGPWVEHRPGLSCDEVCINVRATDGHLNRTITLDNIDITRYRANLDDSVPLDWTPLSHTGFDNHPDERQYHLVGSRVDGATYCWNAAWNDNYWVVKHDADHPVSGGRMTEVILYDGDGDGHVFRAIGYSATTEEW